MAGSSVRLCGNSITMSTVRSVRVVNRGGFDAFLTLSLAVSLRACFRSGLGHQICQSQPAAVKAVVDHDVSCPKIQLDVARNALVETRW